MDAVGSERAAFCGFSEGGNMSALFAATCPERTTALIMFGTFPKRIWSPDYPCASTPKEHQRSYYLIENEWADLLDAKRYAPSKADDPAFCERLATLSPALSQPRRGP